MIEIGSLYTSQHLIYKCLNQTLQEYIYCSNTTRYPYNKLILRHKAFVKDIKICERSTYRWHPSPIWGFAIPNIAETVYRGNADA